MEGKYRIFRYDSRPFFVVSKDYSVIRNKVCYLQNVNFDNMIIQNIHDSTMQVDRLYVDIFCGDLLIQSSLVALEELGRTEKSSYIDGHFNIPPNEAIVISQFFVSFYFSRLADHFRIRIEGNSSLSEALELVHYNQKTELSPPFKGGWVQVGNYHDIWSHRMLKNSEFGNDYIQVDEKLKPYRTNLGQLTEHYCYQAPIYAPASGQVVAVCNDLPDNLRPYNLADLENVVDIYSERVPNVGGGNFIIIDHQNGEYSFLGHLAKGSILPKIGDMVKKGDQIASVGNSGSSSISPHLHYQLMNSCNLDLAYTFPYKFKDCFCSVFSPDMFDQFERSGEHIDFFNDVTLQLLRTSEY